MKEFLKNITQDKPITLAFFMNLFFIIAAIIFILFLYGSLPPFIPIFNQLPWGEQRLGSTFTIFVPVLVSILIFIINVIAAGITYKKIPLVARMLAAISLLISVLTCLFVAKTITLIL